MLYTPMYSPDLNPVELCFNSSLKVKTQLNYHFHKVLPCKANLKLATAFALDTVTLENMHNFYNMTSFI